MPQHVARIAKSGHNLSQSYGFTSACAQIRPVYHDILNAGESVYLSSQLLARANPLMTPALADIEFHLDWFFVPSSMLFTLMPSLSWMTDDRISSFYEDASVTNFPLCNINSFLQITLPQGASNEVIERDYATWVSSADAGAHGDCLGKSRFRLAEDLGFNPFGVFKPYYDARFALADWKSPDEEEDVKQAYTGCRNPNVLPLAPLAYQCIYQKHFRNPDREPFDISSFNIDRFYNQDIFSYDDYFHSTSDAMKNYSPLFTLRAVDRYKDYFTSVKPSPIMSGVSMLGSSVPSVSTPSAILSRIDNWLTRDNGTVLTTNSPFNDADSTSISRGSTGFDVGSVEKISVFDSGVSPANIRSVFAIEKVLRITGRASKDYDSQVLAHFGFKVPHDPKHEISHIGHDSGIMHIGEVISAADTYNDANDTGSALGSMSGKGYVFVNGKKRKFTAPCHGVLMCTYYPLPRVRYYGGFDKQNAITDRLSFYWPEYDKLGMQPLFGYELDYRAISHDMLPVGWQFRYEQFKRKYDRVSTAFMTPSEYQKRQGIINQYSAWVVAQRPLGGLAWDKSEAWKAPNIVWQTFKGSVHDLDNIMTMPYDSVFHNHYFFSPWLMFDTDPFICDYHANVKLVSTMSPTGEPDLDF